MQKPDASVVAFAAPAATPKRNASGTVYPFNSAHTKAAVNEFAGADGADDCDGRRDGLPHAVAVGDDRAARARP